ncbi:hypothetical protein FB192DRAFT_1474314 [Mucor lusitanicus]|nr:hypothetical protein FB192DRAFT_1474314 [Mucor lusitanicus]
MFIGDRGYGTGSYIKKHQRVGGPWQGKLHGSNTKVFVTNEYNSSQTCLYCYRKLSHTYKQKEGKKTLNRGSFICHNPECVGRFRVLPRDRVSAMAIGLAGLSQVLFGVTIPEFDPHPTAAKSKEFNKKAEEFCRTFIV